MKRKKRFAIRLVALGLAVTALSAAPAQARLDEGLGYPQVTPAQQGVIAADDLTGRVTPGTMQPTAVVSSTRILSADDLVGRVTPGTTQPTEVVSSTRILSADDLVGRATPTPGQPSVVSSDDGFEFRTIGIGGFVLVLGAIGAYLIVHQSNKEKLASA